MMKKTESGGGSWHANSRLRPRSRTNISDAVNRLIGRIIGAILGG